MLGMGLTIRNHVAQIALLCQQHHATTYLDFGCGKAQAYAEKYKIQQYFCVKHLRLYDPALPSFAEKPVGLFDAVVCIDVAEHIEEQELDEFFQEIFAHVGQFLFITICCRPSSKTLPDGRNAHVTIHPIEWWRDRIARHNDRHKWVYIVETQ